MGLSCGLLTSVTSLLSFIFRIDSLLELLFPAICFSLLSRSSFGCLNQQFFYPSPARLCMVSPFSCTHTCRMLPQRAASCTSWREAESLEVCWVESHPPCSLLSVLWSVFTGDWRRSRCESNRWFFNLRVNVLLDRSLKPFYKIRCILVVSMSSYVIRLVNSIGRADVHLA